MKDLLEADGGYEQCDATKSSIADRYDLLDSGERRVSRTALLAIWQAEDSYCGLLRLLAAHPSPDCEDRER
jgi:hypothetical protein